MAALRRRLRSERGANSIEFVLYTPLMLLVILVIVQFALTWHANQVASATAREAARHARDGVSEADAENAEGAAWAFLAEVGGHQLDGESIEVVYVDADTVRATVTGRGREIIPGLTPQVAQIIEGPREQFIPDL